jgi:hypothetical protein
MLKVLHQKILKTIATANPNLVRVGVCLAITLVISVAITGLVDHQDVFAISQHNPSTGSGTPMLSGLPILKPIPYS